MKHTLTVACLSLKSAWQAVSLRSALTTLLLGAQAALYADNKPTPIPAAPLVETVSEKISSLTIRSGKNKLTLPFSDSGEKIHIYN